MILAITKAFCKARRWSGSSTPLLMHRERMSAFSSFLRALVAVFRQYLSTPFFSWIAERYLISRGSEVSIKTDYFTVSEACQPRNGQIIPAANYRSHLVSPNLLVAERPSWLADYQLRRQIPKHDKDFGLTMGLPLQVLRLWNSYLERQKDWSALFAVACEHICQINRYFASIKNPEFNMPLLRVDIQTTSH